LWIAPVIILTAYAVPLLNTDASIQWDAVDVHYSAQRYFAERIVHGDIPFWTPYIFSGFPFMADPQTGGWYPGNWPFLLAGASPKAIEAELAFHAILAAAGVFLLLRRWLGESAAAAGALSYALGGFFAGHSSHIGMFESAALFPWLLVALFMAVDGKLWRGALLGTAAGGALILTGHFQTALYAFSGLASLAIAATIRKPIEIAKRAVVFLAIVAAGAVLLSAIQTLPGLELTAQSNRATTDTSSSTEGAMDVRALSTLVLPDSLGATSGAYNGPGDVTQYYFYAGVLLLPLAALGLRNASIRSYALWLLIPGILYMAGPSLGFFRLVAWLPGFRQVRAPVHAWFVVAMALAILGAAGVEWLASRWRWAGPAIVAILAFDLCVNNVWNNPLAYAHASFDSLYGNRLDMARQKLVPAVPRSTRFEAPDALTAFGPMNHPLDLRLETTYGYNPLQLARYGEFRQAMSRNSKLRDSLAVSRILNPTNGTLVDNPSQLPWAYFPKEILAVSSDNEALRALEDLDPPRQAILSQPVPSVQQDPAASATMEPEGEQAYRVRYKSATAGVLRLSLPYFPGWEATVDGAACPVLRADYAMTAVLVPAGDKELKLRFHSTRFATGAALSGCGILLLAALATMAKRRDLSRTD
jgi:hypothetical protein